MNVVVAILSIVVGVIFLAGVSIPEVDKWGAVFNIAVAALLFANAYFLVK